MALLNAVHTLTSVAQPVRVLVVDDSAYMRHVISRYLDEAAELEVVGAARNGEEALTLVRELNPDVVTMDIEMPRLDGLATLREIMAHTPRPVVMLSSLTAQGATETIRALTWGAVDFVTKPAARANIAAVMDEVIAKVRLAARTKVTPLPGGQTAPLRAKPRTPPSRRLARTRSVRDKVVVIGASTGGPRALQTVLSQLPPDLPASLLIVQHMPAGFTAPLAERLNTNSAFTIREAAAGDALEVGQGLVAPGGYHMLLNRDDRITLNQNPTIHGVRPAADATLAAVAHHFGEAAVGVILTGMGSDGAQGAMLLHSLGGKVIAEAEETCVVWGMPRSVIEAGVADVVAPLPEVAGVIERIVRQA